MLLEHLTRSELIEKFSNVANYTVLFCEYKFPETLFHELIHLIFLFSVIWSVWVNWCLLLEEGRSNNS